MLFYSRTECEEWCTALGIQLDDRRNPELECTDLIWNERKPRILRFRFPDKPSRFLWFAETLQNALQWQESCMVWMTDYGVIPSAENLHLYYRFRQSYGDLRHLNNAPGHLCLKFERPEVVTLIYLSLLFGWGTHVIPVAGFGRIFIDDDEWGQIALTDETQYEQLSAALKENLIVSQK